jgi:hypothetical protein
LTAILEDQLPHIVQNVIHLRIRQVVELNPARFNVNAAGDMTIGFDEQRSYTSCDGTRGDLRQIVGAKLFRSGHPEHFDQSGQRAR